MEISTNLNSLEDSNLFLRALWAEFRKVFGKCAWQFSPFKEGGKNRIYFGWADIGVRTLEISVSYRRKGIINKLHFGVVQKDETSLCQKLTFAVQNALQLRENPYIFQVSASLLSKSGQISSYSREGFEIYPKNGKNELLIKISAFDKLDAFTEAQPIIARILDFLAVCTNSVFDYERIDIVKVNQNKFFEEVYLREFDWIDDYPYFKGQLILLECQTNFINSIVLGETPLNHSFLRACGHFHIAQKLWPGYKDGRWSELASVQYISAIEVATTLLPFLEKSCKECGQRVYSIRKRVKELTRLYSNDYVEKHIDNYYALRSKYLHDGILSSNYSYSGTSIPLLDPSSETGCFTQVPLLPVNLREFVGYILRKVFVGQVIQNSVKSYCLSLSEDYLNPKTFAERNQNRDKGEKICQSSNFIVRVATRNLRNWFSGLTRRWSAPTAARPRWKS